MAQVEQVHALLIDIEAQLRQMGLWQAVPPSPEALASSQPFCIDTLDFSQWLQFFSGFGAETASQVASAGHSQRDAVAEGFARRIQRRLGRVPFALSLAQVAHRDPELNAFG